MSSHSLVLEAIIALSIYYMHACTCIYTICLQVCGNVLVSVQTAVV